MEGVFTFFHSPLSLPPLSSPLPFPFPFLPYPFSSVPFPHPPLDMGPLKPRASILKGLGEQSPTFLKVGVDGLVIWVTYF